MHFTALNGSHASAVGAHDGQILKLTRGDGLADLSAHAGGLDAGNGAVLDHGNDGIMGLTHGAGADGDVLDPHLVHFLHHHVHHIVSLAEVVVEGDGHAVVGIALDQSLVDVLDHLVVVIAHHGGDLRAGLLEGLAVLIIVALEDLFAGALEDLFGNFSADCVQHNYKSPLYTPDAFARSMVRFAPS